MRSGGQVDEDEPGTGGLGAHAVENGLADVVHIKIQEAGFGSEDQHAGNQFVVRMPLAIRKPARAGDATERGDGR